jgi:DNA-binding XRE family transcriptional regulator
MGRHKEAIAGIAELLGTVPDRELARRLGVAGSTIAYHRTQRNIAPVAIGKLADWRDRLGTMPDDDLATLAGVSRQAVSAMRRRRGIRRYEPAEPNAS